jgi:hypothetical protein
MHQHLHYRPRMAWWWPAAVWPLVGLGLVGADGLAARLRPWLVERAVSFEPVNPEDIA